MYYTGSTFWRVKKINTSNFYRVPVITHGSDGHVPVMISIYIKINIFVGNIRRYHTAPRRFL